LSERAIILSDLHLAVSGAGGFAEDVALVGLIERLLGDDIDTELVLAGDIFDFLLDPEYDGFSREVAVARLARVLEAHCEVVAALRAFGARAGNSIAVLPGNHDPELGLPEVRAHLASELGVARLGDEVELVPARGTPALFGHTIGPEGAPVWVVHGDRWDPDNFIARASLRERGEVALPLGSRLVIEVLRDLRAAGYEWIYWLKPELATVVPLLLYLDPQRTWACVGAHLGLSAKLLASQVRTLTRSTGLFDGGAATGERPPEWIADLAATLGAPSRAGGARDEVEATLAALERALERGHPPVRQDALTGHGGLRKWLIRAWLAGVRRRDCFAMPDGPDPIRDRMRSMIPSEVAAVVVGHTHGARAFEGPRYVNTGTWLPVVGVPEGELEEVIDAIERGELRGQAPRSYAEVSFDGSPRVRLCWCDDRGAERIGEP